MAAMDDPRIEHAVREARQLRSKLTLSIVAGQLTMLAVLGVMAYLNVEMKWIVVTGFFLSVGTLAAAIQGVAMRLEAGRSFLEQIAVDIEERLNCRIQ